MPERAPAPLAAGRGSACAAGPVVLAAGVQARQRETGKDDGVSMNEPVPIQGESGARQARSGHVPATCFPGYGIDIPLMGAHGPYTCVVTWSGHRFA